MHEIELFGRGISSVFHVVPLLLTLAGTILGIIFGAVPGLTATMGIVLMLPFTFGTDPISGICLLIGIFIGGVSGGLISATLLRMPGTPSSVATTFDAYPMAVEKGEPAKALGIGVFSSFFAGWITFLLLSFLAPLIASFALKFGHFEYFSLGVFALTIVAAVSRGSMLKGLIAGFLGMLFAVFGPAPIDYTQRYTFGTDLLQCGFALLPVLIGLFAVSQILKESGNPKTVLVPKVKEKTTLLPLSTFKGEWPNIIKSSLIGFFIGVLPGIGASTANVVSYGQAKSSHPHPEKFGTGCVSGIVASESANNGTIGGVLVPLLTMGVPGDSVTAVLLGALMIHGIQPGPLLFDHHPDIVYGIFVCVALANVFMFILMVFGMRYFIKVLSLPKRYLLPLIMAFCVIGCYALNNQLSDVWTLIIFGIIGYTLERIDVPLVPVILGVVLEPIIETNLREGLMASMGSWLPIFTRPISLGFILVAFIFLIFGIWGNPFSRKKAT